MMEQTSTQSIKQKLMQIADQAVQAAGLALYELEYLPQKKFLRIYIINEETKTAVIEECVKIDQLVTPHLDELSNIPTGITLEVSSPGLFRELKQKKHFEWSKDSRIKVYIKPEAGLLTLKGKKRLEVLGQLQKVEDDLNGFAISILPEGEKVAIEITSNNIVKALTEPKI